MTVRSAVYVASELLRQEVIDDCHMVAHSIGFELVRGVGLDANSNLTAATLQLVPRCPDGMCVDGCLHAVMISLLGIALHGKADRTARHVAAQAIYRSACAMFDNKYACTHGFGHGLGAAMISGLISIDESLALCNQLVPETPEWCEGGFLMETVGARIIAAVSNAAARIEGEANADEGVAPPGIAANGLPFDSALAGEEVEGGFTPGDQIEPFGEMHDEQQHLLDFEHAAEEKKEEEEEEEEGGAQSGRTGPVAATAIEGHAIAMDDGDDGAPSMYFARGQLCNGIPSRLQRWCVQHVGEALAFATCHDVGSAFHGCEAAAGEPEMVHSCKDAAQEEVNFASSFHTQATPDDGTAPPAIAVAQFMLGPCGSKGAAAPIDPTSPAGRWCCGGQFIPAETTMGAEDVHRDGGWRLTKQWVCAEAPLWVAEGKGGGEGGDGGEGGAGSDGSDGSDGSADSDGGKGGDGGDGSSNQQVQMRGDVHDAAAKAGAQPHSSLLSATPPTSSLRIPASSLSTLSPASPPPALHSASIAGETTPLQRTGSGGSGGSGGSISTRGEASMLLALGSAALLCLLAGWWRQRQRRRPAHKVADVKSAGHVQKVKMVELMPDADL